MSTIIPQALAYLIRRKKISSRFKGASVTFELLPNSELRKLKKKYLKKDVPVVDVLSFPQPKGFPGGEEGGQYLGEIYVNRDIVRREPARGKFLVIHGLLHLVGFSHHRKRDRIEMEKLEQDILKHLE